MIHFQEHEMGWKWIICFEPRWNPSENWSYISSGYWHGHSSCIPLLQAWISLTVSGVGQVALLHLAVTLSAEDEGDGGLRGWKRGSRGSHQFLTISAWNERGGFCSHFIGQHWSHDTNLTGVAGAGGRSYKMQRNANEHHLCHSFGEMQLDNKASLCMQRCS